MVLYKTLFRPTRATQWDSSQNTVKQKPCVFEESIKVGLRRQAVSLDNVQHSSLGML